MPFQFPYSQNTAPLIFVLNYVAKCTVGGIVEWEELFEWADVVVGFCIQSVNILSLLYSASCFCSLCTILQGEHVLWDVGGEARDLARHFFPEAVSVHCIISSFALSPYTLTVCVAKHLTFCA